MRKWGGGRRKGKRGLKEKVEVACNNIVCYLRDINDEKTTKLMLKQGFEVPECRWVQFH